MEPLTRTLTRSRILPAITFSSSTPLPLVSAVGRSPSPPPSPFPFFFAGVLRCIVHCLKQLHRKKPSTGPNRFFSDDRDGVATFEEVPAVEKNVINEMLSPEEPKLDSASEEESQMFEFLEKLIKVYPLLNHFYRFIIVSIDPLTGKN
ncbi:hypothetical protein F3Y22_tig00110013pilonHSYRG00485 [Hibiscus syriacus]|uniref:Uncharacterized protein n=1 Tax=Hibiscus syriacus TaxID=106335 RepID=A0A6A3BU66_HIBSY|nr:hypothetical protein F3Y22_tig00110013pilonHSYRG00485 [Hibiscus syriacus]